MADDSDDSNDFDPKRHRHSRNHKGFHPKPHGQHGGDKPEPVRDNRVRYVAIGFSVAIIVIYFLEHLVGGEHAFAFMASEFLERPWTIVTSMFLHSTDDFMHLLNNLFFLVVFGFILENRLGSPAFVFVFFTGGIAANLSAFIFYPDTFVLGASGAVSAIVAALATIRPRDVGLFWGAPVPMWVALVGWIVTNLVGFGSDAGIAYEAHLFGLAYGIIYGLFVREKHSYMKNNGDDEDDNDHRIEFDIEEWERKYMHRD